jgi:hypothetical protein
VWVGGFFLLTPPASPPPSPPPPPRHCVRTGPCDAGQDPMKETLRCTRDHLGEAEKAFARVLQIARVVFAFAAE